MNRRSFRPLLAPITLAVLGAVGLFLLGQDSCGSTLTTHDLSMRDGVVLVTDAWTSQSGAPAPTIVMRTPYTREASQDVVDNLIEAGYSIVNQDMRGTGASGGTFMLWTDDGWSANQDGYDTIEWGTAGDWSTGESCMYGMSALAISSLMAAGAAPPSLRCVYSLMGAGNIFQTVAWQGGAIRVDPAVSWLEALGAYESLDALYAHPTFDDFWAQNHLPDRYASVDVPIYHTSGWYDVFQQGSLDDFAGIQAGGGEGARGRQKLLIGPWTHGGLSGELEYPENSAFPGGEEDRWFAHWLQGVANGIDTEPPVKYYLMGDPTATGTPGNVWIEADSWPPPAIETPFYIQPDGLLLQDPPAADAPPVQFAFDPNDPVPTWGGPNLYLPAGPMDQRVVLYREDVLLYLSPPLQEPLAVVGRLKAKLWVSSSALDTDFTVKLMDVYDDWTAMLVQDGIIRMRSRNGQDHTELMNPDEIYQVDVDLWSTAQVFDRGHMIAIAISSSNAPRFDVNPNTGGTIGEPWAPIAATQTVYQDAAHPSQIILPVVSLTDLLE